MFLPQQRTPPLVVTAQTCCMPGAISAIWSQSGPAPRQCPPPPSVVASDLSVRASVGAGPSGGEPSGGGPSGGAASEGTRVSVNASPPSGKLALSPPASAVASAD